MTATPTDTDHLPPADEDVLDVAHVVAASKRHLSKGRAAMAELMGGHTEVASDGPWIFGHDGRRYLDCGGYGVFILGHCHPLVTAAVTRQVITHPLATRVFVEPTAVRAAEALAGITPAGLEYAHFVCSGAEATEAAIKMARGLGRRRLVSMQGGYHGKTMGALSVTGRAVYQEPFAPLLPDRVHVPYGDAAALREELAREPGTACVILEPIQSEGGVVVPPEGFLRAVRALCDEFDATMVVDEIFTGLGRTGRMWACEAEGVVPDIMLVGKGLSGGVVPVAAAVATPEAYALLNRDPLMHSSTFGASPIATAAAEAAVRATVSEAVPERAAALGETILADLRAVTSAICGHLVADVRGRGLLLAVEFADPAYAGDFLIELADAGVVVNHSMNASAVVRLTPPVCLDDDDLAFLRGALGHAAEALARIHPPTTRG